MIVVHKEIIYKIVTAGIQGPAGAITAIPDNVPVVSDSTDETKLLRFELDALTTGTTRIIIMPDSNVDLGAVLAHIAASTEVHGLVAGSAVVGTNDGQVLLNKVLEAPDLWDAVDNTKLMDFDLTSITTGNTRTLTMSDYNLDLGNVFYDNGPGGTFAGNITIETITPDLNFTQTDGATDEKETDYFAAGSSLYIRFLNDARTLSNDALAIARSGYTVGAWTFSGTKFNFNESFINGSFTSTATTDILELKPSDYGTGKPYFGINKTSIANKWTVGIYDGVDTSGTVDFGCTNLTHNAKTIANLTDAQTFIGVQTLNSPVLNTGVSGTAIKDEDNMVSNSATHLATQQSIKAYADGLTAAVLLDEDDFASDSNVYAPTQQSTKAYINNTHPLNTVSSAKNTAARTLTTTPVSVVTLDLGTVAVGDVFLVSGEVNIQTGGTSGTCYVGIIKSSGTATAYFEHDDTSANIHFDPAFSISTQIEGAASHIMRISVAGTLVLEITGNSSGSNSTVPIGKGQIAAVQLYNA